MAHLKIGLKNIAHLMGTLPRSAYDHHYPGLVKGEVAPVEKLEAHIRGLKHKAVSVFMVHGQDILIQKSLEKISHAGIMGQYLLHTSKLGRTPNMRTP